MLPLVSLSLQKLFIYSPKQRDIPIFLSCTEQEVRGLYAFRHTGYQISIQVYDLPDHASSYAGESLMLSCAYEYLRACKPFCHVSARQLLMQFKYNLVQISFTFLSGSRHRRCSHLAPLACCMYEVHPSKVKWGKWRGSGKKASARFGPSLYSAMVICCTG